MKKRFSIKDVFNVRPLVVGLIAQILGIVAMKNDLYALSLGVVATLLLAALFDHGKNKERTFYLLWCAGFFAFGFLSAYAQMMIYESGEYELIGLFRGHVAFVENDGYVYCKDVFFNDEYIGNAVLTTSYDCTVGSDIYFSGTATRRSIFNDYSVSSKLLQFSAKYSIKDVAIEKTYAFSPTFDEKVRILYRRELFSNMSYQSAALCYGMMFGDTSYISSETLETMRSSGVAHIFAVSGLHVGLLYSLIDRLFKGGNRVLRAVFIPVALFAYAYICGNSPSSLRAATMFTVTSLATSFFLPSDRPNTIAMAGIVVLAISPFSVYSAGCLMSFGVVITLMLLANFFKDVLKKESFNAILSNANSSVTASIGSLPLISHYFGHISLVAPIVNIIVVPTVGVIYPLTFLLLPIGYVLKLNLLGVSDLLMSFVKSVCELFYRLGVILYYKATVFEIVVYYAIILVISEYCFLKKGQKTIVAGVLSVLLFASILL